MVWTKKKIAALLALLAGGVTGGVVATRGGDEPAQRPAEQRTQAEAPAAEEPPEPEQAEPEPARKERPRRRREAPRVRAIRSGDTLWEIASDQLGSKAPDRSVARRVNRLATLNDLQDPDLIVAGRKLRVRA